MSPKMVGSWLPLASACYLSAIYLFLYLPIVILIVYSFNNTQYSLLWHGFTLHWYHDLFADTALWTATLHSIILGVLAATIATMLGSLTATCLYRFDFIGKRLLNSLILVLILSPEIVIGAALLILFTLIQLPLGFSSLLLAHISLGFPFAIVTIYSRFAHLNNYLFEAAKDLGATDWQIFNRIILPLLWPALFASWLLSFTLSLDDFIISYFVAGPTFEILPLKIYSMARAGVKPEINALCTALLLLTITFVILSQLALQKKT